MFDIGFSELLVIALVGLIVLGPKRLPEVARTLGQWVARVRRFVADVKQDIDRELQQAELAELRNLKRELDETRQVMERTSGDLINQANIAAPPQAAGVSPTLPSAAAAPTETTTPTPNPPPAPKKPRTKRRKKSTASRPAHGRTR